MQILATAVGRRKEAVAQIQIIKGTGKFIINNKPAEQYLQSNACALISIKSPFTACQLPTTSATSIELSPHPVVVESVLFLKKNQKNKVEETLCSDLGVVPVLGIPELVNTLPAATPSPFNFDQIDTIVKVKGGGLMGQADAIKLGVARAICSIKQNDFSLFTDSQQLRSSTIAKGPSPENSLPSSEIEELIQDVTQDVTPPISVLHDVQKLLKTKGYLTQDSRVKERRKYGLKKARKASQYHKR